ncbi:MAG: hypothetical protein RLZ69_378 [Actinomycetota bacterium]
MAGMRNWASYLWRAGFSVCAVVTATAAVYAWIVPYLAGAAVPALTLRSENLIYQSSSYLATWSVGGRYDYCSRYEYCFWLKLSELQRCHRGIAVTIAVKSKYDRHPVDVINTISRSMYKPNVATEFGTNLLDSDYFQITEITCGLPSRSLPRADI